MNLLTSSSSRRHTQRRLASIDRRFRFILTLGTLALLLLLVRIGWMQTVHTAHFAALSTDNHLRQIAIPPPRGLIFDRNGTLLVDNGAQYELRLIPAQVPNLEATLAQLRELVPIKDHELKAFKRQSRTHRHTMNSLKQYLSEEDVARLAVNLHRFSGVYVGAYPWRRYTYREATSHTLGYMSRIDAEDMKRINLHRYRNTHRIGRSGLERQYEEILHGLPGLLQAQVNAQGRILKTDDRKIPSPGTNLILSLDTKLQQAASQELEGKEGSIVAIEPSSGDILAMASSPSYDPDLLGGSISQAIYQQIFENPNKPMLNRAVQGVYSPGSTIKPFMALAGLESGNAHPSREFFAGPTFKLPNSNRPFRDWKERGHGWVTLADSITQSCDVFFYSLAHRMGVQYIHDFLAPFGFGQVHNVDLPSELPGLLPSPKWKRASVGEPWYPEETINIGIGQGYMLATPLQLAVATAALATRGLRLRPRLLRGFERDGTVTWLPSETVTQIHLSNPQWWQHVTDAMIDVVHAPNGTAQRSGIGASYLIAGKTGTAQVINYGDEYMESEDLPEHLRDHALFIAFAPAYQPKIALAVIVEHGGHGSTAAAPIARRLLDLYLEDDLAL